MEYNLSTLFCALLKPLSPSVCSGLLAKVKYHVFTFFGCVSKYLIQDQLSLQIINCIWKHPDAPLVYLICNLLGQEDILQQVSQTFGSKIFVDESMKAGYKALELIDPEILTQDPSSRFHLLGGFPKLRQRAKPLLRDAQTNFQHEPLIIRPSTQWYVHEELSEVFTTRKQVISEAIKDQHGIWHVCYSMHSSKEELEWALQILGPKWVVSTTPGCRAMDLDYVKKKLSCSSLTSNGLIWKLFGIVEESSSDLDVSTMEVGCSPMVEAPAQINIDPQLQPVKLYAVPKEMLNVLSSSNLPPLTLFGRARLGAKEADLLLEEVPYPSTGNDEPVEAVGGKVIDLSIHDANNGQLSDESSENSENEVNSEEKHKKFANDGLLVDNNASISSERVRLHVSEVKVTSMNDTHPPKPVGSNVEELYIHVQKGRVKGNESLVDCEDVGSIPETHAGKLIDDRITVCCNSHLLSVGSSKGFNDKFRKLYRSMNVPVPKPLPSLVELMKSRKRTKKNAYF